MLLEQLRRQESTPLMERIALWKIWIPLPASTAAVTRKRFERTACRRFYPAECVDVETAVDAYTMESAYHEFREDVKGRLKVGYYADLVVLDREISSPASPKRFWGQTLC